MQLRTGGRAISPIHSIAARHVIPSRPTSRPARPSKAALKRAALQQAIFDSATFSSITTDERGVIQLFNVGAERMLGFSAADVIDRLTPADISEPDELATRAQRLSVEFGITVAPGFPALVFKASRGDEDISELTYVRKDRSRFHAMVSVTALRDARERIIGYLLISADNTARKLIEAERALLAQQFEAALLEKNAELEAARQSADKANQAKSEFLSSMSHELRSPLNAILGFAQLMESDPTPVTESQKGSIAQILNAGWYLLQLINEILDLAAIESGKLSLSLEPVSLAEVMPECQAIIEQLGLKRGVTLHFPRFEQPFFIRADRTRLKQVLINLLTNAVKYNQAGGSVTLECERVGNRTKLSVRDTGRGLSEAKVALLFQPFNRLGQEVTGEEGTGIGLVMSKLLVELMGGVIGVESVEGRGSVFWFELASAEAPRLLEDAATTRPAPAPTSEPRAQRTVLYVEDNAANLSLVEQLFARRPDLRLLSAMTGRLGVELARREQPDIVLMDINLPGISGLEALELLRADPRTAHIPVVAVTANAMPSDIKHGLEAGFFQYVTKPIKVGAFMEAVRLALDFAEKGSSKW